MLPGNDEHAQTTLSKIGVTIFGRTISISSYLCMDTYVPNTRWKLKDIEFKRRLDSIKSSPKKGEFVSMKDIRGYWRLSST